MEFFEQSAFFGVMLSLAGYGLGILIQKRCKIALLNPMLISIALCITVLVTAHVSYETYYEGAKYLSYLLTPATVCLAVPLYEKLALLRKNWAAILAGIFSGVLTSLSSVLALCLLFHLTHEDAWRPRDADGGRHHRHRHDRQHHRPRRLPPVPAHRSHRQRRGHRLRGPRLRDRQGAGDGRGGGRYEQPFHRGLRSFDRGVRVRVFPIPVSGALPAHFP